MSLESDTYPTENEISDIKTCEVCYQKAWESSLKY